MRKRTTATSRLKNKKPKLVMAASISAAAAMLGCSVVVLKKAKKEGAPGFRANGSVCISELKPWLEENLDRLSESDSKEALECRRLLAQCKKLEFQNEVELGSYTPNDKVRSDGMALGALVDSETMRFVSDVPTWAGLPAEEMEKRTKDLREKIRAAFRSAVERIK
jgi:uncharacterized protein YceK